MTLYATIGGYVQGVGFRAFVRAAALRLGLRGYVRNMDDGSVFVSATGERHALEELLALLVKGPSGSRVVSVRHQWMNYAPGETGHSFEVRG